MRAWLRRLLWRVLGPVPASDPLPVERERLASVWLEDLDGMKVAGPEPVVLRRILPGYWRNLRRVELGVYRWAAASRVVLQFQDGRTKLTTGPREVANGDAIVFEPTRLQFVEDGYGREWPA